MIALGFLIALAPLAFAGNLADQAIIKEVASSNGNGDVFYLRLGGGTGPCANLSVDFPRSKSQSEQSYDQAFAIALAASMSGKRVQVYNYENDDCSGANFIRVYTN